MEAEVINHWLAWLGVWLGCGIVARAMCMYDMHKGCNCKPEKILEVMCLVMGPIMLLVGIIIAIMEGRSGLMWSYPVTPEEKALNKAEKAWRKATIRYRWGKLPSVKRRGL